MREGSYDGLEVVEEGFGGERGVEAGEATTKKKKKKKRQENPGPETGKTTTKTGGKREKTRKKTEGERGITTDWKWSKTGLMAREASRQARWRIGSGTFGSRSSNGSMMMLNPEAPHATHQPFYAGKHVSLFFGGGGLKGGGERRRFFFSWIFFLGGGWKPWV